MMKLLVVFGLIGLAGAVPVDNGVEGDPEIECGPTSIAVNFNTANGFEGNVYVKNRFNDDSCKEPGTGRQTAGIELGFDECGTRRIRSLNPKGVFVTTNIVVSFHPLFLTKVDRAYKIQCFYMEADKTVDTDLIVSMLTTEFQTQVVPMPVCRYEILDGGPGGAPVEFAIIGQQIYHQWTCDTETIDTFCMVVRDCFVDDTNGDSVDLVNTEGCAADLYLLNNPEYTGDLMAGVDAHVFKYADREDLYFQCQITILVKEPGEECPRPVCPTPAGRGAGQANPQLGPVNGNPDHPFPLQPGSPYLPGGGGRDGGFGGGPTGAFGGAAGFGGGGFGEEFGPFVDPPVGAFVDPRGRRKRAVELSSVGSVDVAAAFASLGLESRSNASASPNPDSLRGLLYKTTVSSEDMCVSPGIFYAFALVAACATLAFALLSMKLYYQQGGAK